MWWLGFAFHEVSAGFLSVFIPLYIIYLGGSLTHVGLASSLVTLLAIPASFLWGYLCDKSRRYKPYILLSFLSITILLYALTLTTDIHLLITLYAVMSFLHVAHEPPKNVLIAESYTRRSWERAYALYGGIVNTSCLIGVFLGTYMSIQGLIASHALLVCSILNFTAFITSVFLVREPFFIFERSLVKIEKNILRAYNGLLTALKAMNGACRIEYYTENSTKRFCFGILLFFMATNMLFAPLPIFFSREIALTESMVYTLFCMNFLGSITGHLLMLYSNLEMKSLYRVSALRGILALSLVAARGSDHGVALSALVLFLLGFLYAIFHTLSLSMSMEILPEGMTGVFNVLTGLGGALGSFLGSFLAEKSGFTYLFLGAGLSFLTAYVILKTAIK
ncbi:MAG: MFS transporter [Candidatus Bathyarchaeia archaeon]|nr:MFS transporter [Candidatus Bathyarchaeota archaeon]